MSMNPLRAQDYNPDILNTLANLSSDEVFTPPEVANQVLDLLPRELFCSPDTTFLDIILQDLIQFNGYVDRLPLAG